MEQEERGRQSECKKNQENGCVIEATVRAEEVRELKRNDKKMKRDGRRKRTNLETKNCARRSGQAAKLTANLTQEERGHFVC